MVWLHFERYFVSCLLHDPFPSSEFRSLLGFRHLGFFLSALSASVGSTGIVAERLLLDDGAVKVKICSASGSAYLLACSCCSIDLFLERSAIEGPSPPINRPLSNSLIWGSSS